MRTLVLLAAALGPIAWSGGASAAPAPVSLGGSNASAYPAEALAQQAEATVWLRCYDGARPPQRSTCSVIFSTRTDLGFEAAAERLIPRLSWADRSLGGGFGLAFTLSGGQPKVEAVPMPPSVLTASGQPAPPEETFVANPAFQFRGLSDPSRYYPLRAAQEHVQGVAVARCLVGPAGGLDGCVIESETPEGYSFGAATLYLTRYVHTAAADPDGKSRVGRPVRFTGKWSLPGQ